jgi:hypothetical protein
METERRDAHRAAGRRFPSPDPGSGELPEPPADTRDIADLVADRLEHADRRKDLRAVKLRDRRALFLKGLGYSYREIQTLTGGATYTAVNRRITEGRQQLRTLARERDAVYRAAREAAEAGEGGEEAGEPS